MMCREWFSTFLEKGEKLPKRNAVREIEAILIMHKLLRSEAPSSKAIVIRPRSLCFLGHLPLAGRLLLPPLLLCARKQHYCIALIVLNPGPALDLIHPIHGPLPTANDYER